MGISSYLKGHFPWQRLYFLPLPQGHFSLRPILWSASVTMWRFSSHRAQVQAAGCAAYQLGLTMFHLVGRPLGRDFSFGLGIKGYFTQKP